MSQTFFCFILPLIASIFSPDYPKTESKVEKGNVIYAFGDGLMQCQSQIDPQGKMAILFKPLRENTTVTFSDVRKGARSDPSKYVITFVLRVKEDTDLCGSWTNLQEVKMEVDPIDVKALSFVGEKVYSSGNITVLEEK